MPEPKKERKKPVRTPASPLMLALSAAERIFKKLPEHQREKFRQMFMQLTAEPPLFADKADAAGKIS